MRGLIKLQNRSFKGIPILFVTAVIWGFAFTAQSAGAEYLDGFSYTSIRFFLGALSLLPVVFIFERNATDKLKLRRSLLSGACCGSVMFAATAAQQFGIQISRNSGKAGFITSLYILIVPIFGLLLRRFPKFNTWLGVIFGIVGMYLLTVRGSSGIEKGDLLVMLSAFLWAAHILCIDKFASEVYALRFAVSQFMTVAVLGGIFALIFESLTLEAVKLAWLPIVYGGLGSVGIAFTLQIIGQKSTEPVAASLILSLESVFAAVGGALLLNERLDIKGYVGCALIFIGIILAQLNINHKKSK